MRRARASRPEPARRSMFGSSCELCLVLSPWRWRSPEQPKHVYECLHPGQCLEWPGGRIAGGCTTGAAHVVGRLWRRAGVSLRPPQCRGQPWYRTHGTRVPGPGRIARSQSRRDLRKAMCRSVPALAVCRCPGPVRSSSESVLGFAEDAVGTRTTVLGSGRLASGQQRVRINNRYHLKTPS